MEEAIRAAIREHAARCARLSPGDGIDALLERRLLEVTETLPADRHQPADEPDRDSAALCGCQARDGRNRSMHSAPSAFAVVALRAGRRGLCRVALQQITLPGVYMDAVNPDYCAAGVLNPPSRGDRRGCCPGTICSRFPVLISFYHGAQQFWLGLPFFWLFGTSVTGLRLTHAMFGSSCSPRCMRSSAQRHEAWRQRSPAPRSPSTRRSRTPSARRATSRSRPRRGFSSACLARAGLAGGARPTRGRRERPVLRLRGRRLLHLCLLPAALAAAVRWSPPATRRARGCARRRRAPRRLLPSPRYVLAARHSAAPARRGTIPADPAGHQRVRRDKPDRRRTRAHVGNMAGAVFENWFHHALIFGEHGEVPVAASRSPSSWARRSCCGHGPSGGSSRRRSADSGRARPLASPPSPSSSACAFRATLRRLLPISYARARIGSCRARERTACLAHDGWTVAAPFAAPDRSQRRGPDQGGIRLHELRGVGLFSDAINRLGADLDARARKPFVYFPSGPLDARRVPYQRPRRHGLDRQLPGRAASPVPGT